MLYRRPVYCYMRLILPSHPFGLYTNVKIAHAQTVTLTASKSPQSLITHLIYRVIRVLFVS